MRDPLWLIAALRELNVSEIPGMRHNPRIIEYHRATKLAARTDETPWCSSFVGWCIAQAELAPTGEANARSWLDWGDDLVEPRLGAVVILARGDPPAGHVGFWIAGDHRWAFVLGGNQGNRVSVAPFPRDRVLGYRWPIISVPESTPA